MHIGILIGTALAAVAAGSVARADPPRECAALPRPDPAALESYRKAGPYAAGLRLPAGRPGAVARALEKAWAQVRRDLGGAFAAAKPGCSPAHVQPALHRSVFVAPPLAVPAEDRFAPPRPVLWTVAIARCEAGDPGAAAAWLAQAALPGDPEATAAAATLWASGNSAGRALALLPTGDSCRGACLPARALALARSGRRDDARAVPLPDRSTAPVHVRAAMDLVAAALEDPR